MAHYLACTDWPGGHSRDLISLAETLCPREGMIALIRLTHFDPFRFRSRLRWAMASGIAGTGMVSESRANSQKCE